MPRIRTIKPEFFRHEELQDLEKANPGAYVMLVFAGIWTQCDKDGRFEWKPRTLKLDLLPFLDFDMEATLAVLSGGGFIRRYEVAGKVFGVIATWEKHQRITGKEATEGGKYPEPPENSPEIPKASTENQEGNNGETTGKHPGAQEMEKERKRNNPHPLPFPAVREILELSAKRVQADTAKDFHAGLVAELEGNGWVLTTEHWVDDRGDGHRGRIDILVTSPAAIGIELDRVSVREKSAFKLRQIDGYRVAILREATGAPLPEGLHAVICCGSQSATQENKRERKPRTTLKTFADTCKQAGVGVVSEYRGLQEYVEATGLPSDFVQLAWEVFKAQFLPGGTHENRQQADWRRHFLNYVRNNYFRLWYAKPGGGDTPEYALSTAGMQAQAEIAARGRRHGQT